MASKLDTFDSTLDGLGIEPEYWTPLREITGGKVDNLKYVETQDLAEYGLGAAEARGAMPTACEDGGGKVRNGLGSLVSRPRPTSPSCFAPPASGLLLSVMPFAAAAVASLLRPGRC